MRSHINEDFDKAFERLPEHVQEQARAAYRLFQENPYHPSLQFKLVNAAASIYSARVGLHYRVLGVKRGEDIIWFWIGPHSAYDKLIS